MAANRGLGKGLSALISENYVQPTAQKKAADAAPKETGMGVTTVSVAQLHAGKYQPRARFDDAALGELSESIKKNGVMQPIIVRPSSKYSGKYEIIAGERRWRASKMASLEQVPVIIRDLTDKEALEFALVENIQRQDLSPLEEALGYQRLIEEFDYTQEELASVVGKSRSHVANLLRLLTLPEEVKLMLDKGELTMGHARALLTAKDPVALAKEIVSKGLNVRDAERFSKGAQEPKSNAPRGTSNRRQTSSKDPDILALEASLSDDLGIRVSIHDRGQSGEIVLAYDSLSQLDNILQRLGRAI
ncbi:MAG: ParB/RepB/Spo0J family partition protein [Rickettsiales bacterium]|nr:ParB/RepB/Spo0J family partition protein [Rickettsiales bacterium]